MGKMHVGKWGNSLAVRLPREIVERFGIKEGDAISDEGIVSKLEAVQAEALAARRKAALEAIGEGRFTLPPDWKFDRDEANWRPAMDRW
jgi:antitoxin MazE